MNEQIGTTAFLKRMRTNLPAWSEKLPEIPALAHDFLRKAVDGRLQINYKSEQLQQLRKDINSNNTRTVTAIGAAAFIISAAITLVQDNPATERLMGAPLSSWLFGTIGLVLLLVALLSERD
jgi:ubiquinone biosynthesis protein